MNEVLPNIFGLFYIVNPDNPYGLYIAKEFEKNRPSHVEKVAFFTQKYANPLICNINKEYVDS